jgi:diguanylate cyclase (GGDEF)-like protein/PAS domain S-box-containing protein
MFSMKKNLMVIFLGSMFVIATASLGFYLWQEYKNTNLTAAERRTLAELDNIVLVGDYGFPPLSFTDDEGQYSGYEADLVNVLEIWLGIPIVYYQMIWSEALEALAAGEVTGITGMRVTSERALIYNFSEPYWQTSYSFVCTAGSDYETILASDYPVVIVQKGSATYEYFLNNFYREDIEFIWIEYPAEAVTILGKGEADLWFENYHVARHEVLKAGMIDLFVFYIIPESIGNYAFALGPDYTFLVPIINKGLLNMERDGILSELDNKWFGLTDLRPAHSPWRLTMPVAAYSLFTLFLLILFWNRFLQMRIDHKTEELRKSEEKLRASFEGAHDSIFITTKEGKILDCNINTLDLFGCKSKDEFLALNYKELSPKKQPDSSRSDLLSREIVRSVIDSGNLLKFEWLHLRKNGSTFPAEVALTTYQLDGQNVIQASISDITERKRIQNQLEFLSMHDQLTGLYNRAYFEEDLKRLKDSRHYPITLISADLDGLKLINDSLGHQTGDLLLVACAGILKESIRTSDLLARIGGDEFCIVMPKTDQETGESIARRIRSNISQYNKEHSDLPLGLSLGLATAKKNDVMLNELFKQADDLMYRDKLYRSASVKNKVVQSLLAALAERDYITEGHAQRLEENCLAVGEKINLSSRQLADLALLAKVHDLGKVGISDQILYKPASLSAEEWTIMKRHTEKGFRIARSSPDLSGIADLILKHHERWDGSGYPLALSGEDIPIECRILALVDAYDAMTHDRPYAKAKSLEEAIIEIKNGAGNQFDPYLAEIFIAIIENR